MASSQLQSVRDAATDQNFRALADRKIGADNLLQVFVRKVAELPEEGLAGELAYNEEDNKLYCHNGTEWKATF